MSIEHSPGPWKASEDGLSVRDSEDNIIAVLRREIDRKPIAALPELLNVVQGAERLLSDLVAGNIEKVTQVAPYVLENYRRVIAKVSQKGD